MSLNEKAVKVLCQQLGFNSRGSIETKVIEITPDLAKQMLELSAGNRVLKATHLRNLESQIKSASFVVTNNAIGFDKELNLRDGHHRLTAISNSKKNVLASVSVNISGDSFRYIDRGVIRSISDVIQLSSKKNFGFSINKNSVATANFIIRIAQIGGYEKNLDSNFVEAVLLENKKGFSFVEDNFSSGVRSINNAGVRAAIVCAANFVDDEKLALFCTAVLRGATFMHSVDSNAALVCHQYLKDPFRINSQLGLKDKNGSFTTARVSFMVVQHCIRAFVSGNNLMRVVTGVTRDKETNALTFKSPIYNAKIPVNQQE
jgi:hypothetical protein